MGTIDSGFPHDLIGERDLESLCEVGEILRDLLIGEFGCHAEPRSRASLNESFIAQICVRFSRARLSETRVVVVLLRRISRLRSG